MDDVMLNELEEALRAQRLEVDAVEDLFNISQGTGPMANRANIDPRPLTEALAEDPAQRRRQIAAYASGVKHVLLEPKRSKAADWTFVESTGSLLPSIDVATFELGVEAASGEKAWTLDFVDDLKITYYIHLHRGIRVLTEAQVENWGVSEDRITSAARSLLFHKTRQVKPAAFQSYERVRRLHGGDGHDAARSLVVADVFYTEIGEGFRFSMPSPDHLLLVFEGDAESLEELRTATREVYDEVDYPLSSRIFRFHKSKPIPVEE